MCKIIEKLKFSKFPSRIPQYVGKMDEVIAGHERKGKRELFEHNLEINLF